jgi:hypothetical protein
MGKMEHINTTTLLVGKKIESAKLKDREWNGRKVLKLMLQDKYVRRGLSRKVIVISAELK